MGNYATTAELIARFQSTVDAAWATDNEDVGTVDTDVANEVINNAESTIDGYVAVRNATPMAVSGDTVLANWAKSLTLDIAMWNLSMRPSHSFASEWVERQYEAAIKRLETVAAGKFILPAAAAQPTTASNTPDVTWGIAGEAVSGTNQRIFSRETQERL